MVLVVLANVSEGQKSEARRPIVAMLYLNLMSIFVGFLEGFMYP